MEYAFVTIEHPNFGKKDIKISRNLTVKIMLWQLFLALGLPPEQSGSFYLKAVNRGVLLSPTDTLKEAGLFDGELLRIL